MKKNIILVALTFCFLSSCNSKGVSVPKNPTINNKDSLGVDIDSIYSSLSKGKSITYKKVSGSFSYDETRADNVYIANFHSNEFTRSIQYVSYPGEKNDEVLWDKRNFKIESKLDPFSLTIYELELTNQNYILFEGHSQSASGSGAELTYFILFQLDKNSRIKNYLEFQSRFGTINSITDYDRDGDFDYFKIENAKRLGEYLLTIRNVQDDRKVNTTQLLLKKSPNDNFLIIHDTLSIGE